MRCQKRWFSGAFLRPGRLPSVRPGTDMSFRHEFTGSENGWVSETSVRHRLRYRPLADKIGVQIDLISLFGDKLGDSWGIAAVLLIAPTSKKSDQRCRTKE